MLSVTLKLWNGRPKDTWTYDSWLMFFDYLALNLLMVFRIRRLASSRLWGSMSGITQAVLCLFQSFLHQKCAILLIFQNTYIIAERQNVIIYTDGYHDTKWICESSIKVKIKLIQLFQWKYKNTKIYDVSSGKLVSSSLARTKKFFLLRYNCVYIV